MAINFPTSSNTVGGLSNVAARANVDNLFSSDSNFASSNTSQDRIGRSSAISANGDYLVISTSSTPVGKTYTANIGGVVVLFTRSGNTWTQDRSFVSGDLVSGSNVNRFGERNDKVGSRSVSMDDAGETLAMVGGENYNNGRIEFWGRSGSTWSRTNSFDGSSNEYLGVNGMQLAGDGNSAIVFTISAIKRYVKSSGSWSADSTHGSYTPTSSSGTNSHELWSDDNFHVGYNTDGTKYTWPSQGPTGTNRINTRYYDGSSWQTSTPTTIDTSSIVGASPGGIGRFTMSQDGNYCFVGYWDDNLYSGIISFVWNSGTNTWTQQQIFDISDQRSDSRLGFSGPLLTNNDGSKLVAGGQLDNGAQDKDYMWRCWERSGSTWTFKNKYHYINGNQIPSGQTVAQANNGPSGGQGSSASGGVMSKDGLHIIMTHPVAVNNGLGPITHFQATGIIVSAVSNGQTHTGGGKTYTYDSAKTVWKSSKLPGFDSGQVVSILNAKCS